MLNNNSAQYDYTKTWAPQVAFALLLTALALLIQGYLFPHSNHGQEVPPILAMLDAQLYQNDFAIQSYLTPGVRSYYQSLIAFIVASIGLSLPAAYFSLYCLSLFSFILATQKIAIRVATFAKAENTWVPFFATGILVFLSLVSLNSWGSEIFIPLAIPSSFAMGITAWGIYAAIKQQWLIAYSAFGLAAFLQFLIGFLPGLVLFTAFALHTIETRRWLTASTSIFLWGAGLASVYIPLALHSTPTPTDFNFLETFGLYRVPHHWSPSTGSFFNWSSDILLLIASMALSRHLYKSDCAQVKWLALICGSGILVATLAVILNYLFVDIWQVTLIGKLQFQRIMPFGHFLIFLLLLFMAIRLIHENRTLHVAALILSPLTNAFGLIALLVSCSFIQKDKLSRKQIAIFVALTASLLLLSILVFKYSDITEITGWDSSTSEGLILLVSFLLASSVVYLKDKRLRNTLLATSISFLTLVIASSTQLKALTSITNLTEPLQSNIIFDRTNQLPGLELAEALAEHSDVNDVVLLPPTRDSFTSTFQLASKRAAFFSFKNVPYDDYYVWIWTERAKHLLGVDTLKPHTPKREQAALFKKRASSDIEKLARDNGACYIVSRKDWHSFYGEVLASEEIKNRSWLLWMLTDCQPEPK